MPGLPHTMSDSDEEAQKQVLEAFGRITNSGIQLQFHIIEYLTASDRWVILKNRKNDSLLHRLILLNLSAHTLSDSIYLKLLISSYLNHNLRSLIT